jgi:hypothetical protein
MPFAMDESTKGKWDPVIQFPLIPVAAATLKDGRVRTFTLAKPLASGARLSLLEMVHE